MTQEVYFKANLAFCFAVCAFFFAVVSSATTIFISSYRKHAQAPGHCILRQPCSMSESIFHWLTRVSSVAKPHTQLAHCLQTVKGFIGWRLHAHCPKVDAQKHPEHTHTQKKKIQAEVNEHVKHPLMQMIHVDLILDEMIDKTVVSAWEIQPAAH